MVMSARWREVSPRGGSRAAWAALALALAACGSSEAQPSQAGGKGSGGAQAAAGVGGSGGGRPPVPGGAGSGAEASSSGGSGVAGESAGGESARAGTIGSGGTGNGGAGEGGEVAGEGGQGCGALLGCDDGDPCTVDAPGDACGCEHLSLPDGSPCDDRDVCTDGDVCEAGVCAGEATDREPVVLGELRSFGHEPGLRTLVAFPSATRAVYARTGRLTLLALDGERAHVLDDSAMGPQVGTDSIGSMVWASRPRTFLIPVLDQHLAVVSQGRGIDLFDLTDDRIAASERYGFDPGGLPLVGAAGLGSRLFTCTSSAVQTWSIDPDTRLITAGATAKLPPGRPCQELALAPDGATLFAATSGSLERFDVSSANGPPVLGTPGRVGNLVADVQVTADFVAVYEIRESTSGFGDVSVLAPDTLEVVTTFAAELGEGGSVPVGFGLLNGGQLFLQTIRGGDCLQGEASVYAISAAPEKLTSLPSQSTCTSPFRAPSFNSIARGEYAVLEPMHQLLHVAPGTGELTVMPVPEQGSFERVLSGGAGSALAYGPASAHRLDLSDPTRPVVSGGGLVLPLELEWLRVDLTSPASAAVVTVPGATSEPLAGALASLLRADAGPPRPSGSLATHAAESVWSAAGSSLYELSPSGTADFELRRFATHSIGDDEAQELTPSLEQALSTSTPAELDVRRSPLFEVDASNGDLVVLERRATSGTSASDTAVLSLFAPAAGGYEHRFSTTLGDGIGASLAAGGGRAAFLFGGMVELVERDGERTEVPLDDGTDLEVERVLGLDAGRLLLSATWSVPHKARGVLVFDTETLSELARYETTEAITSFASVGDHYVFGAPSAVAVAVPACPSP